MWSNIFTYTQVRGRPRRRTLASMEARARARFAGTLRYISAPCGRAVHLSTLRVPVVRVHAARSTASPKATRPPPPPTHPSTDTAIPPARVSCVSARVGARTQLRFEFLEGASGAPVALGRTFMSFYDFDLGRNSAAREAVQIGPQVRAPVSLPCVSPMVLTRSSPAARTRASYPHRVLLRWPNVFGSTRRPSRSSGRSERRSNPTTNGTTCSPRTRSLGSRSRTRVGRTVSGQGSCMRARRVALEKTTRPTRTISLQTKRRVR